MGEIICDVYWENAKPFEDGKTEVQEGRVLYALFGTHPLYGSNVLLYIGMTTQGTEIRLGQHAWWAEDELDNMTVKFGSIKEFRTVEEWRHSTNPGVELKPHEVQPDGKNIIYDVESLLIYAHQPAYNTQNKASIKLKKKIRIFNSGKRGLLFPELSWAYFDESVEK